MENSIILTVNFSGRSKFVRVKSTSSFKEFHDQITGTWSELLLIGFSCSFSAGQLINCVLGSDSDMSMLVEFCELSNLKIVPVVITLTDDPCHINEKVVPPPPSAPPMENINPPVSKCAPTPMDKSPTPVTQYDQSSLGHDYPHSKPTVKEFSGIGRIPNFDICPDEKPKSYLSDHWGDIMRDGVGLVFLGGAPEFRRELIKYSTKLKFRYRYVRNTDRYVHAACTEMKDGACGWFIKAKRQPTNGGFIISKVNLVHSCVGNLLLGKNSRFGKTIIKDIVMQDVRGNPNIGGKEIIKAVKKGYGFDIPYGKAWRGVEAARNEIFGGYVESYDHLRWYAEAVQKTNPGSIVDIEKNSVSSQFERIFVSFKACMEGFKNCRPMLFIDGTFMKGRAKGVLLVATAKDGENGLFPVAFAVVSAETKDNWAWFLRKLRDHIQHEKQVIYISDRNIGLMSAFYEVWEQPAHFYCLYHLLANLKGRYGGGWTTDHREKMAEHFKACAYAPNPRIFNEKIDIFKEVGGSIAEKWLEDLPFERWAVAHSSHIKRYGEMTSNAAESFNSWIREARSLPITFMIDSIRKKISRWFVERREVSSSWTGSLVPTKEALWHHQANISDSWFVSKFPNGQFEVYSSHSVSVDVLHRTCSCFQWQIRGFPCAHAVAVIKKHCTSVFNIVENCFLTDNYRKCYKEDLNPVPESEMLECSSRFEDDRILPPELNNPPGRPKKKRKNSYGEWRRVKPSVCPWCNKIGRHDPVTCAAAYKADSIRLSQ